VVAALAGHAPLTVAAKALGGAAPAVGSGIGGRVTAADMVAQKPLTSSHSPLATDNYTDTPIKGVRKIIAERMWSSLAESAQFTLNMEANAAKMQELRKRFKHSGGEGSPLSGLEKITVNDLVLFATSRILTQFPYMNAHKLSGTNGDFVRTFERVHLGVAVDTPRGLMVPVIRNADLLTLRQISGEAKRVAKAAQEGTIKPEELSGSTFTVSNLGSFGVTSFTPVINTPEVAILGVGAIKMQPVEDDSGDCCDFTFEPHIGLSLTINHQIVDGAPAARFLKALSVALADIDLLLAL
jgi:pyruvate dehydrogenase E2 component (dihydrolipoamide acetyltransferase)